MPDPQATGSCAATLREIAAAIEQDPIWVHEADELRRIAAELESGRE